MRCSLDAYVCFLTGPNEDVSRFRFRRKSERLRQIANSVRGIIIIVDGTLCSICRCDRRFVVSEFVADRISEARHDRILFQANEFSAFIYIGALENRPPAGVTESVVGYQGLII